MDFKSEILHIVSSEIHLICGDTPEALYKKAGLTMLMNNIEKSDIDSSSTVIGKIQELQEQISNAMIGAFDEFEIMLTVVDQALQEITHIWGERLAEELISIQHSINLY
jgi:hypothetical protein